MLCAHTSRRFKPDRFADGGYEIMVSTVVGNAAAC
jgi:hypothetical protein